MENTPLLQHNQRRLHWSKKSIIINLVFLFLVFMGNWCTYHVLELLQSSINGDIGIYSITLGYICKTVSSLLGVKIVDKITPKWTLVMSSVCITIYTAANFWPKWYVMFPAGALVGKDTK